MSDIIIKSEKEDEDQSSSSLGELTSLLEEVKKEEQKAMSDDEAQTENNKEPVETLPESFFDDLYREEIEAASVEETTDADIQKLQEIIARKKRILNDELEDDDNSNQGNIPSQSSTQRKRKEDKQNENSTPSNSKRQRNTIDPPELTTEAPIQQTPSDKNDQQPQNDNFAPSIEENKFTDPELELERLLKTEDYNFDEETEGTPTNAAQPMFTFPNGMPMIPSMFNPKTNQMMPNMLNGGFPMMFNMGFPQGFYPPNMNMQMMGCGPQQMNSQQSNDNEVQCLPVSNPDLVKIPFKKIKLEKTPVPTTDAPPEDPKEKVVNNCLQLLKKMKLTEPSGKFVYTSTVTKDNKTSASNSVLLKFTNVSYNFQAIGPKQNLLDWGLREIPIGNAGVAKNINMSADRYFNKILENSNSIARKLIKQEVNKAEKNQEHHKTEVEEPTLSTYFKNSMTQTDPLTCRECVARKRKVGHNIAVQTVRFSGSIGVQTEPDVRFDNNHLTEGLNENQLKSMYEFSKLIREPPKNTPEELSRMRDVLINIYNFSQSQYRGSAPCADFPNSNMGVVRNLDRDPRTTKTMPPDPERFFYNDPRHQTVNTPPVQMPQHALPSYAQQNMQFQNQVSHNRFPGPIRGSHVYNPNISQVHSQQAPPRYRNLENRGHGAQHPDHSLPEYPPDLEVGRKKNYGRGGMRR